jgi:1,4-dihydroxy-2-naphthoyl-CoA hydrolase
MTDAPPDPTQLVHSTMPLCAHLGVRGVRAEKEEVVLTLDWRPELCTIGGLLHGGAVMALADSAGAVAAFLNLPEGAAGTSTISSSTSFLRGMKEGGVATATARVLHAGGTTIAVETAVTDADGRLMAKVTQTQAVLRPRS